MTTNMKNKIRNELNKAFAHFGETNSDILNEKVENELDTLACFMAGSDPETVCTDQGDFTGYLINIEVANGANTNEVVALQMLVAENDIYYIMHSFTAVKPEGWKPGDRKLITNQANYLVALDDVDPAIFN